MRLPLLSAAVCICLSLGHAFADILYTQPPATSGAPLMSSYWDPDGSDYDEYVWDGFMLPAAGNITEIRWRGGGGAVNTFTIAIYASIPAGTQPDLGYMYTGPLVRYHSSGSCNPVPAAGGMNDYSFTLPHAFLAAANVRYWVQIEAWTPSIPTWGIARGTGGNGSHFHRSAGAADAYYYMGSSDAAFTLVGTTAACTTPTVTQNPDPASTCYMTGDVSFSIAATGTGTLAYQWRRNGSPVYDGPNGGGMGGGAWITGATTPTLNIVQPSYYAQPGTYDCVVTNSCGTATSAGADLVVSFGPPTINRYPVSAVTCGGTGVSFDVQATGTGELWYQWEKDGVALVNDQKVSGADTPNLVLASTSPADAGAYDCIVGNVCGGVMCYPAQLMVNSADFDGDGDAGTDFDIQAFFACLGGNCCATCGMSDFNADGDSGTDADIESFFRVLGGGGC